MNFEPAEESFAAAHSMANAFRAAFFRGDLTSPMTELPMILNGLGGVIISVIHGSRFEGVSLVDGGYVFIFVSPRFEGRMLFTLAHELGHVLSHHVSKEGAYFEGASSIGNFTTSTRKERFVDAFASCLLLPDDGVLGFLTQSRANLGIAMNAPLGDIEILLLARFFGVSFAVAAKRCEDLHLLPAGGSFSMVDHVKKLHRSPERRAAELGLPARAVVDFPLISGVLAEAVVQAVEDGVVSAGWVADQFDLSVGDIFALHRASAQK